MNDQAETSGTVRKGKMSKHLSESKSMRAMEKPGTSWTAWEYLTGGFSNCWPDDEQKKLNELGKDGWEVIAVINVGSETRFYLKRPANQKGPP